MAGNIRTSIREFSERHHGAMMAICCIGPVAIVAVLSLSGVTRGVGGRAFSSIISLLCPLSMIGMMVFRGKGHDHGRGTTNSGMSCHSSSGDTVDITKDPDRTGEKKSI